MVKAIGRRGKPRLSSRSTRPTKRQLARAKRLLKQPPSPDSWETQGMNGVFETREQYAQMHAWLTELAGK